MTDFNIKRFLSSKGPIKKRIDRHNLLYYRILEFQRPYRCCDNKAFQSMTSEAGSLVNGYHWKNNLIQGFQNSFSINIDLSLPL